MRKLLVAMKRFQFGVWKASVNSRKVPSTVSLIYCYVDIMQYNALRKFEYWTTLPPAGGGGGVEDCGSLLELIITNSK